jgi:hypothetical protein
MERVAAERRGIGVKPVDEATEADGGRTVEANGILSLRPVADGSGAILSEKR